MRKITAKILEAFRHNRPLKIDNTETDGANVWLFGSKIIRYDEETHGIYFSLAGWNTPTTRERLNGILTGMCLEGITYKKGVAYYDGVAISDTEWHQAINAKEIYEVA